MLSVVEFWFQFFLFGNTHLWANVDNDCFNISDAPNLFLVNLLPSINTNTYYYYYTGYNLQT